MKKFILIATILLSTAAQACISEIYAYRKWTPLSEQQIKCMKSSPDFVAALSSICDPKTSKLDVSFQKYLVFEEKSHALFAELKTATDAATRMSIQRDIQQNTNDWKIYGYMSSANQAMYVIDAAHRDCK